MSGILDELFGEGFTAGILGDDDNEPQDQEQSDEEEASSQS